jgi:dTDP-D-glucose 4,6-dehydratase
MTGYPKRCIISFEIEFDNSKDENKFLDYINDNLPEDLKYCVDVQNLTKYMLLKRKDDIPKERFKILYDSARR